MALVLQRAVNESVVLTTPDGCRIEVKVLNARAPEGGQAETRLVFDAPRNVSIERGEIAER